MGIDVLIEGIRRKKNPSVAGLDPRLDYLPAYLLEEEIARSGETLRAAADAIARFNAALLDSLYDIVPAVKLQAACYEMFGPEGMETMQRTIAYAKSLGLYVILDAKRGDIGSTAESYSAAYLGMVRVGQTDITPYGADALTVNPYLGTDSIRPFLEHVSGLGRSLFVLGRTSNRSSAELQLLPAPDRPLYQVVGELCERWGKPHIGSFGYSQVGLVVGATHPDELLELRRLLPKTFFLVPGYGAQGGTARDAAKAFDELGRGAIINSSRAILCAWQREGTPSAFAEAAREEAIRMRDELRLFINCM